MRTFIQYWGGLGALLLLFFLNDLTPLLFWDSYRNFLNSLPPEFILALMMISGLGVLLAKTEQKVNAKQPSV